LHLNRIAYNSVHLLTVLTNKNGVQLAQFLLVRVTSNDSKQTTNREFGFSSRTGDFYGGV
ncbi:hypothetical protein, partial [Vibrio sp. V37_P2S8PM304]|uniref:hypothetical protein n=1 Tax=Vibrio sp. V37_P2S8PM304 TaxID=1938688 RepID=UPI001F16F875